MIPALNYNPIGRGYTKGQYEALCNMMGGYDIFLTGPAGTGKTRVMREYVEMSRANGRNVLPTASTGLAANIIGGVTVHRALGIGMDLSREKKEALLKKIGELDTLIIDEISMISANLFEVIIKRLCMAGKKPQIILSGDFSQLPPVNMERYSFKYAFESPFWKGLDPVPCFLTENVRHTDPLTRSLNLRAMVGDQSCIPEIMQVVSRERDDRAVFICNYVDIADDENRKYIYTLSGEARTYDAIIEGKDDILERFKSAILKKLTLKIGMEVMTTRNSMHGDMYYNGSTGHVKEMLDDEIVLEMENGYIVSVKREMFRDKEHPDQYVKQFPIKPAHAITIHKSQGRTWDSVNILGNRFWDPGHLYVAISRCTDIRNVHITGELNPKYLKADPRVIQFYNSLANRPAF